MLRPLSNEGILVSVSFRREMNTIADRKSLKLTQKTTKNFRRFDAVSFHFPRAFVVRSNTVKTKKRKLCRTLFEE